MKENQRIIAEELFRKAAITLTGVTAVSAAVEKLREQFSSLKFCVFVPSFRTLRNQTLKRVNGIMNEQASEKLDYDRCIEMYGAAAIHVAYRKKWLEEALSDRNKQTLFVVIVDECHRSPTVVSSAHSIINDPLLMARPNFLVLMVSATPFNCVSLNSRISPSNRILWRNVLADQNRPLQYNPAYVGLDYFFSTLQFRVNCEASLTLKIGSSLITVHIEPISQGRLYASLTSLASDINKCIMDHPEAKSALKFQYLTKESRFAFRNAKCDVSLIPGDLLRALGFSDGAIICPHDEPFLGSLEFTVDNDSPVCAQCIRHDPSVAVFIRHEREGRKMGNLPVEFDHDLEALVNDLRSELEAGSTRVDWNDVEEELKRVSKLVKPETERKELKACPILADYIFSLAYLAIVPFTESDDEISNFSLTMFLKILMLSSYAVRTTSRGQSISLCNVSRHVGCQLKSMLDSACSECRAGTSRLDLLRYIFREKKQAPPSKAQYNRI